MKKTLKRSWAFVLSLVMAMTVITTALPTTASAASPNLADRSTWWEYTGYSSPTYYNSYGGTHAYRLEAYGSNNITSAAAAISYLESSNPKCANFSTHIYGYEAAGGDQQLLFLGYPATGGTDFTIYPETETGMKSVGFDIDFYKASAHTLGGFGILFNAKVTGQNSDGTGGTLRGYQVMFDDTKYSGSTFDGSIVVNRLDKVSADSFFTGGQEQNVLTSKDIVATIDTFGFPRVSTGSGPTFTADDITKLRLDMEFDSTYVKVDIKYYKQDGTEVTSATKPDLTYSFRTELTSKPLNDPGTGYGPFVTHYSHGCSDLTYVNFGNFQMANGYLVDFRLNYGTEGIYERVEIEKENSGLGSKMPNPPTRTDGDYVFKGWNTEKDGSGTTYDKDTEITGTTTLYAQWGKADVAVEYSPDKTWTQGPVDVSVSVDLPHQTKNPTGEILDATGAVIGTFTLTPDGTGKYVATWPVTENLSEYTIKITGENGIIDPKTGLPGEIVLSKPYEVTWIDTISPVVDNLPSVTDKDNLLTAGDFGSVTFEDPDDPNASLSGQKASGVNDSTKTLILYDTSGAYVMEIPFSNLTMQWPNIPSGDYYYDIKVADNVGNVGYASGSEGGLIGSDGKPTTPGGNPVIINPAGPVITETGRSTDDWTNQDVVISYNVTDRITLDTITITGPNNFEVTVSNVDSKNYDGSFTAPENGTYTITATDKNGEITTYDVVVTNIDKISPTLNLTSTDNALKNVTATPADVGSGIDTSKTVVTVTNTTGGVVATGNDLQTVLDSITSSGTYNVEVKVYDFADNSVTKTANNLVLNTGTAITPPSVAGPTITVVGGDAALTSMTASKILTITASDVTNKFNTADAAGTYAGTGKTPNGTIEVLNSSGSLATNVTIKITANTGPTLAAQLSTFSVGTYTLKVYNLAGGVTTKTITVK